MGLQMPQFPDIQLASRSSRLFRSRLASRGSFGENFGFYMYKAFQIVTSFAAGIVALPEFVPAGVVNFPNYPGLGVGIRIATILVVFIILQLFVPTKERS